MESLPSKSSRIEPLNMVGTARCAVRAAFSGATMPPADSRAGTSQRDVPTEVRFMEREECRWPFFMPNTYWPNAGGRILCDETASHRKDVERSYRFYGAGPESQYCSPSDTPSSGPSPPPAGPEGVTGLTSAGRQQPP